MSDDAIKERIDGLEAWVVKLEGQISDLLRILHGDDKLGMVAKVQIVWRSWVWVLCTFSAAIGSLSTFLVMRAIQ